MAERKTTVAFYYKGDLLNKAKEIETVMSRGLKTTTVWNNGIKSSAAYTTTSASALTKMSNGLNGVALRFVGLTALLSLAQRGFQQMTAYINDSIEKYREFSNTMAEVGTMLAGTTFGNIEALTIGVENLARKFGKSAVDMGRGMYEILSAAVDVKDSMQLLDVATKAAVAGLSTVETSVDILTTVMNSYGKEVSQTAEISDILFETVVRGKLRFEDLASSLGYLVPIAASAGIEFEEISAALATATRMGLHVDMAARGLALTIQNIISPTKEAAEAAEQYGVDMSAVGLRAKGLAGFIDELNLAIDKNGITVLPRMIRNMRALRVMVALTSDTGIKGFTKDLQLMAEASGRTNEALSKMLSTQQREAAVIGQSAELIQRRLGEVWSPIKNNIDATKMWFAALFSGGFGYANEQLETLSDNLNKNREAFFESLKTMSTDTKLPLFDRLANLENLDPTKFKEIVEDAIDFEKVAKFFESSDALKVGSIFGDVTKFEGTLNTIDSLFSRISKAENVNFLTPDKMEFSELEHTNFQSVMDTLTEQMGVEPIVISFDLHTAKQQLNDFKTYVNSSLTDTVTNLQTNQDEWYKLANALDTASEQVNTMKVNILELTYTIEDLAEEVEVTQTSLAGLSHTGTLGLTIDTKGYETAIDRIHHFTDMITEYGTDFEEKFYEIFAGKTYTVGGDTLSYVEQYDANLKESIHTISEYNKAEQERKKISNEVNKAILYNNLKIMELELKGMMRRRGLTRQEERIIKKLQIENAKERLKEKRAEVEVAKSTDTDAYDEAKRALEEWFATEQFTLWLMQDNRDDELAQMVQTYAAKQKLLAEFETALDTQYNKLERAHNIEITLFEYIQTNFPVIAKYYEDLYGISIPDSIQDSIDAYTEFMNLTGGNPSGGGGGQGTLHTEGPSSWVDNPLIPPAWNDFLQPIMGYARGTPYVPQTGLYQLHRGEAVIPTHDNNPGNKSMPVVININVTGNTIDPKSEQRIAELIGSAVQRGLMKSNGKSKYRVR
jgi:TP901 family phage tail tape measure protein